MIRGFDSHHARMKGIDDLLAEMMFTFLAVELGIPESNRTNFVLSLVDSDRDEVEIKLNDTKTTELWFKIDEEFGPRVEMRSENRLFYESYAIKIRATTRNLKKMYESMRIDDENTVNR